MLLKPHLSPIPEAIADLGEARIGRWTRLPPDERLVGEHAELRERPVVEWGEL
jgi:hypothetical protein